MDNRVNIVRLLTKVNHLQIDSKGSRKIKLFWFLTLIKDILLLSSTLVPYKFFSCFFTPQVSTLKSQGINSDSEGVLN